MASSEYDQRILAFIARQAIYNNPLLAQNLFQVLGLSFQLSGKLNRARRLRKLDTSRDTRSLDLYHSIIWLSREGLAMTEVYILPYCQDGECGPEARVMAARLRAAFYHNFCLYHNSPPVSQIRNGMYSAGQMGNTINEKSHESAIRKATLRDAIPSMTSESSYITNPYAFGSQSPLPSYPVPPLPMTPPRNTPALPPGLEGTLNYNPPVSSAAYIMPVLDYTPIALKYFKTAVSLADELLTPAHPLRLTVVLEYCNFLVDCLGDYEMSTSVSKRTIITARKECGYMEKAVVGDVQALIRELAELGQKGEAILENASVSTKRERPHVNLSHLASSPPPHPPPDRELPTPPRRSMPRPRQDIGPPPEHRLPTPPLPSDHLQGLGITKSSPEGDAGFSGTEGRSATLVGSPATFKLVPETNLEKSTGDGIRPEPVDDVTKRSRASSRSAKSTKSARRRTEGTGTEKERKRRAVQRAEEELMRKKSGNSDTGTILRDI